MDGTTDKLDADKVPRPILNTWVLEAFKGEGVKLLVQIDNLPHHEWLLCQKNNKSQFWSLSLKTTCRVFGNKNWEWKKKQW